MTHAAHTPGPWLADEDMVFDAHGRRVADCAANEDDDSPISDLEVEANARAIALAMNCHADLLSAMEFLSGDADILRAMSKMPISHAMVAASAAIAKARGLA